MVLIHENQPRGKVNKSVLFKTIGYEPHPAQWAVHNSDARYRVLNCGTRFGKTTCAAGEALAAAMVPRKKGRGWVVSATYALCDKVFREIVDYAGEHLKDRIIKYRESDRTLILATGNGCQSEIIGKSADNPASLLGEAIQWCVIDEAAQLTPKIWPSYLRARLADYAGWALFISTPRPGWFKTIYQYGIDGTKRRPDWESWHYTTWDNPHITREELEGMKNSMPEQAYLQEVMAEFLEGFDVVFRRVRDCATMDNQPPIAGMSYYAGLDLAKVNDFTVLRILNKARQEVFAERYNRLDWAIQYARIVARTKEYNNALTTVDTTGPGDPIYDNLRTLGVRVKPYSLSGQTKKALIDNLIMMIETQKLNILKYDLFPEGVEELENYEYDVSESTGSVKSSAPRGEFDDCVISLGLAAWPLRIRTGKPVFSIA